MNKEIQDRINEVLNVDEDALLDRLRKRVLPRFISPKRMETMSARDPVIRHINEEMNIGFYVNLPELSDDSASAMIVVTNSLLRRMGMTTDQVYRRAVKNLLPSCVVLPFSEILGGMGDLIPEEEYCRIPLLFVSNTTRNNGAASILCKDVKKKLSELLGDPFIILPSSIHEVLCLSYTDGCAGDLMSLSEMVREIHEAAVDPCDRLSNCAWLCKTGKLIPQRAFFSAEV